MALFSRPSMAAVALLLGVATACGSPAADTAGGAATTGPAAVGSPSSATGGATSSSPASSTPAGSVPGSTVGSSAAASSLAGLDVVDLASGRSVPLSSLLAPDRPTLFWAWSPY